MRVLVRGRHNADDRVSAYLDLLGVDDPPPPGLPGLQLLQRAHVARVPWTTLDMVLRWDAPADEASCVRRVLSRRAGFCFHLNGAFGWLLDQLGYDVTRHRAGVHPRSRWDGAGVDGSHLTLTVRVGWRSRYLVDVGLGSALVEPVRLVEGEFSDGLFRYQMRRSAVVTGGWRLEHDPRAESFVAMEFDPEPVGFVDAAERSDELAGPGSAFARQLVAFRRDAEALVQLEASGCGGSRTAADGCG